MKVKKLLCPRLIVMINMSFMLACNGFGVTLSTQTPTTSASLSLEGQIATSRSDGAEQLFIPNPPTSAQNPAFSPDGKRLVFTLFEQGYNDGPAGLYLLDLATLEVSRLTPKEDQDNVNLPGSAWINPPSLLSNGYETAKGGMIVFASDRMDADDLWMISPDGSDLHRITTHNGEPWYIEPSWSPDGQWIVFEARQPRFNGDGGLGQIWKVHHDGTDLNHLTTGDYDDRQPNWSPTGDRILFQRREVPDGNWEIFTISPDGSHVRNVTSTPYNDTDASWSPDGEFIVYSSDHGGLSVPNLFIIPAAGGTPTRLTYDETHEDGAPSWSPDGKWVVFESHLGQSEETSTGIWRISAPLLSGSFIFLPIVQKGMHP